MHPTTTQTLIGYIVGASYNVGKQDMYVWHNTRYSNICHMTNMNSQIDASSHHWLNNRYDGMKVFLSLPLLQLVGYNYAWNKKQGIGYSMELLIC